MGRQMPAMPEGRERWRGSRVRLYRTRQPGITAEEKYKKLDDGTTSRYVYYGCSRSKDHHCKTQYVREENLIEQLAALVDKIDLNELGVLHRLEQEIERHQKFERSVMGVTEAKNEDAKAKDVNLRNYVKYLLKEGSLIEKRELMACFKSRLTMKDKQVLIRSGNDQKANIS